MATADELQAKVERILGDYERWKARGMAPWRGWVYPDLHGIVIGVESEDLDAARTALESAYGRVIEVEYQGPIIPV